MKFRKDPKYLYWGITAVCVVLLSVACALVFSNLPGFFAACKKLFSIIAPVVYGIAIAYILNPIMVRVERCLFSFFESRKMKAKAAKKLSRALGVITAIAVGIAVVYAFFAMLLPNLASNRLTV